MKTKHAENLSQEEQEKGGGEMKKGRRLYVATDFEDSSMRLLKN